MNYAEKDIISQGVPRGGIYGVSEDQEFALGVKFIPQDGSGRVFRYTKNGSTALTKGKMTQASAPVSDHVNIAIGTKASAGEYELSISTTLSTAVTENQYKDGYLLVNDGSAEGYSARIKSNTAGTTPKIVLHEDLIEDVEATDEVSLIAHARNAVIVVPSSASADNPSSVVTGIPLNDVPADYYFWAQVKGEAPVLIASGGTVVVGKDAGFPTSLSVATTGACDGTTTLPWGKTRALLSAANFTLLDLDLD